MPEDTTRRGFLAAAGSGAAAALAGCSSNPPSETNTESATPEDEGTPEPTATKTETPDEKPKGGTLKLASEGPVQTLDPVSAKGSGAGYNQYNAALMNFSDGDLPPVADLATDYSVSNDGKTYTFELREGVTFHDGTELTAQDFVYSWERLAGAEETKNADDIVGGTFTVAHEGNTSESVTNYEPGTLAVEAVDDYTFEFTLQSQFTGALSQIAGGAFAPIPAGAVAYPKDFESHDNVDGLLYDGEYEYNEYFSTKGDGPFFAGAGPFKVDSWSKGDQIKLSAFEDYYGEGPYIDAISYTVIGNASTRFKRFKNGNLDIVGDIPTAEFNPDNRTIDRDRGSYQVGTYELGNGNTVNYGQATALDTDYILFNCSRTPKAVRKAFAYLLDQEQIANQVYKGLPEPAYHLTPPPVYMAREGETPADNYDKHAQDGFRSELDSASGGYPYGVGETKIEAAKQVMKDAGYGPDNRYDVEFTVFSGNPAWDQISKQLRDKSETAFMNVDITKADFGTIISKAINGEMDMFSLGDGMEWPEADNFLRFLHPYTDPSFMFTRWTYNVSASEVEFGGDDTDAVAAAVYEQLPDSVAEDHVTASEGGEESSNSVTVVIDDVSKSDLQSALDAAGYSYGSVSENGADWDPLMPEADDAWDELYKPNTGAGPEAQKKRDKAYTILEEVNWETVQELPTTHTVTQRLWNPEVNVRMAGTMEDQTYNTLTIEREE